MSYVIEKGIPLPPKGSTESIAEMLRRMEVGDSIFFAGKYQSYFGMTFVRLMPKKFTTRAVKTEPKGVRVWRVA